MGINISGPQTDQGDQSQDDLISASLHSRALREASG